jgi:hypothetical protein
MSARVLALDDPEAVGRVLDELSGALAEGRVRGLVVVAIHADGGFEPFWGASQTLGVHAGSILRGAVAYLGARMDQEALEG